MFLDGPNVKIGAGKDAAGLGIWKLARSTIMFLLAPQRNKSLRRNADVAQLVAHHLAKVRVASSSLVIRSTLF